MDDVSAVIASLETAAAAGDLSDAVYAEYIRLCPESADLMAHADPHMRGRMLAGVYELLMLPDAEAQAETIAFEVTTHRDYGARRHMYDHLFQALWTVTREACGDAWQPEWDAAWRRRTAALLAEIDDYARV